MAPGLKKVVVTAGDHSPDHAAAEDMLQAEVGELSVSVASAAPSCGSQLAPSLSGRKKAAQPR